MEKGILKKLKVVREPVPVAGLRRKELLYLCNDGNFYRQRELAKKIDLCTAAFRARATRMHWSHPDFLSPSKTAGKKRKRIKKFKPCPEGIVALVALGKTSRKTNLAKLAGPGSLERSAKI